MGKNTELRQTYRQMLSELGLKRKELSEVLGIHVDSISRWGNEPPEYVMAYLRLRVYIKTHLEKLRVLSEEEYW